MNNCQADLMADVRINHDSPIKYFHKW